MLPSAPVPPLKQYKPRSTFGLWWLAKYAKRQGENGTSAGQVVRLLVQESELSPDDTLVASRPA